MDQDIQRNSHCHWRNIHIYACMCGLYVVVNFHWSTAAKQGIGIEWFSYSLVCLFFYFESLQCLKQQWKVTNLWCSERKDHRYFLWNHKHIWTEHKRLLKLFIRLERNVFPLASLLFDVGWDHLHYVFLWFGKMRLASASSAWNLWDFPELSGPRGQLVYFS